MILFQTIPFFLSMILLITVDLAAGRYLLVDIDDSQGILILTYSSYRIAIYWMTKKNNNSAHISQIFYLSKNPFCRPRIATRQNFTPLPTLSLLHPELKVLFAAR